MLIGINGYQRVGKDTFLLLANKLSCGKFGRVGLADPLRAFSYAVFGEYGDEMKEIVNDQLGFSPRILMQKCGTEFMRNTFGDDIWLRIAKNKIDQINNDGKIPVITDVRFSNEAEFVKNQGGIVIQIKRNGFGGSGHASEKGIDDKLVDFIIENNGTMQDYERSINNFLINL